MPHQPLDRTREERNLADRLRAAVEESIDTEQAESLRSVDSASGVPLFRISLPSEIGPRRFVVKVSSPGGDWIARATRDEGAREVALFLAGLPELLPPAMEWPALAARKDGKDAWHLVMIDLEADAGANLVPPGDDPVPEELITQFLVHLACLHRTFLDRRQRFTDVGFCDIAAWLTLLGPATVARERGGNDPVTPHLAPGWDAFARLAPAQVARKIVELLVDPTPLAEALGAGPATLLHGDFKFGNLGWREGESGSTIVLDWSQAMWGPPLLDLGWFLAVNSARLPFSKEHAIGIYRDQVRELYGDGWERSLDFALLGGGVLRLGWAKALGVASDDPVVAARDRAELDWWLPVAERALARLETEKGLT
ncbi:MAG TPA: aminoglycoside phosphotransferase family protein, partial [Thermomicrobiales bacterium]|nr:aminoglycoside phosphotransferase family protein [Thermomicrobiales bacterium]